MLAFALPGIAGLLIWVLMILLAVGVIYWLITTICPEPLRKYAIAVVVVFGVIILIYLLAPYASGPARLP